jgi:hypothetical protein
MDLLMLLVVDKRCNADTCCFLQGGIWDLIMLCVLCCGWGQLVVRKDTVVGCFLPQKKKKTFVALGPSALIMNLILDLTHGLHFGIWMTVANWIPFGGLSNL